MKHLPFNSYEKIPDSLNNLQIDDAGYRLLEKTDWVVTEKVHGANLCFVTDGAEIRCAKRKGWITEDDNFFNYRILLDRLTPNIQQVFGFVKDEYPLATQVLIYGELFGGGYPHPDVKPDSRVQLVQTGVYYSPTIEFYAFDVAICTADNVAEKIYLDYDRSLDIFQQTGLFHARPLFVGKYHDADNYPIEFDANIPGWLGLPLLSNNFAEGVTIKPIESIYVATKKGDIRPILKKKIAAFAEDRRFHQAQKWPIERSPIAANTLTDLKWEVFNLVTENRLTSAISKVGNDYHHQSRKIFYLFIEDIFQELGEQKQEALASLIADETKQLTAYTQAEARKLFQSVFK